MNIFEGVKHETQYQTIYPPPPLGNSGDSDNDYRLGDYYLDGEIVTAKELRKWIHKICRWCGITSKACPSLHYRHIPGWVTHHERKTLLGECNFDSTTTGEIWVSYEGHTAKERWLWHTLGHELAHQLFDRRHVKFRTKEDEEAACDLMGEIMMGAMTEYEIDE